MCSSMFLIIWRLSKTKTISRKAPCKQVQLFWFVIFASGANTTAASEERACRSSPCQAPRLSKHGRAKLSRRSVQGMQEPTATGGELSTAPEARLREVPSFAQLVELLPLHSLSTNSTHYAGMAPWSAATCSLCELLLTVQPMRVLTQRKTFSHSCF